MQAKFLLDQQLAQNLINFFGQSWLNNYSSYHSHYTAEQASESVIQHIDYCFMHGFEASWSLGGTSNNCYGGSDSVSAEIEPELPLLDEFLMEFYPQTSFMQYKIISKFIERSTHSDNDYYGGTTTNGNKKLDFSDLSQSLIKSQLIVDYNEVYCSDMDDYINEHYSAEKLSSIFKPAVPKKKNLKKTKTNV